MLEGAIASRNSGCRAC